MSKQWERKNRRYRSTAPLTGRGRIQLDGSTAGGRNGEIQAYHLVPAQQQCTLLRLLCTGNFRIKASIEEDSVSQIRGFETERFAVNIHGFFTVT